jgi:hypothetical protein
MQDINGRYVMFTVDIDEWLNKANMDTLSPTDVDDEVSRTSTSDQVSMRTSSSGGVSVHVLYLNLSTIRFLVN